MRIIDRHHGTIAFTKTVIVGPAFLFGEGEIAIPGYAIAAEPDTFVRAIREGVTYVIEDRGHQWRLHRVLARHAEGHIIGKRPITVAKEAA